MSNFEVAKEWGSHRELNDDSISTNTISTTDEAANAVDVKHILNAIHPHRIDADVSVGTDDNKSKRRQPKEVIINLVGYEDDNLSNLSSESKIDRLIKENLEKIRNENSPHRILENFKNENSSNKSNFPPNDIAETKLMKKQLQSVKKVESRKVITMELPDLAKSKPKKR
jgi:hypothetical protein